MGPVLVAATLAAAALGGAAGSPAPHVVSRVETSRPVVAFTFDACATKTRTYGFDRRVWAVLEKTRTPITVFASGRWLEAHPREAAAMAQSGFVQFGNHSYDHPHMARMSVARIRKEIARTDAALERLGQHAVAFRAPYLETSRRLLRVVSERGLTTVAADVVSGDPSCARAATMVSRVLERARPGSILIFHINARGRGPRRLRMRTADALPDILKGLGERGLTPVPLSELLTAEPPSPDAPAPR